MDLQWNEESGASRLDLFETGSLSTKGHHQGQAMQSQPCSSHSSLRAQDTAGAGMDGAQGI